METHRETVGVGVKRGFPSGKLLEKQVDVFLDKTENTQKTIGKLIVEEPPSPELLKIYVKSLGFYRRGRYRRSISRELNRTATS